MGTRYTHLQPEERLTLASLKQQGLSLISLSGLLRRSPSTLCRELARNAHAQGYSFKRAQLAGERRRYLARPIAKLHPDGPLCSVVRYLLTQRWSPQQIARILQRMYPHDRSGQVSHQSIYTAIYAYPRGELKRQLIALLRQGHSTRKRRLAGHDRRGQIPEMLSIDVRAPEVDERLMPGHWEGELIKGAGNRSAVGVLVERCTRLVVLCKMADASAQSALAAFTAKLRPIAAPLRQSLTYDRGKEMACHRQLSQATGVQVYFCDPHSPWQRGSCENTNGLLRQFLPKGEDLSRYDQQALDEIADLMNTRPRQTLHWRTPYIWTRPCHQPLPVNKETRLHLYIRPVRASTHVLVANIV